MTELNDEIKRALAELEENIVTGGIKCNIVMGILMPVTGYQATQIFNDLSERVSDPFVGNIIFTVGTGLSGMCGLLGLTFLGITARKLYLKANYKPKDNTPAP